MITIDEKKNLLYEFFMWLRYNGKNHLDKSIEKMIEIYLNEKTKQNEN